MEGNDTSDTTNNDRAKWAEAAVQAFADVTGLDTSKDADGFDTAISDLLADIRHLCDREGLDMGEMDRRAHKRYLEELEEGIATRHG